ncbi:MAG: N-acetylmuramoyl-L-alanine amidase-like domain-containing protein, partial [Myxococcales bacterium]
MATLLLLTAALTLSAAPSAPPEVRLEQLVAELATLADNQQRILAASASLLGAPYVNDPLGEGEGQPDADPLLRLDAMDCQTYVETVLAMAASASHDEVEKRLNDLRYDGEVSFGRRHHYFEAQWLPANERKGYVRDVTRTLFADAARTHTKVVTPAQWKSRPRSTHFELPEDRAPIGELKLAYVPLQVFLERAREIPSGSIFAVVREDRPNVPHMVTHMGFVVHQGKSTFVRHAGRSRYQKVVDEPLASFVKRHAAYGRWRVLGV